MRETTMGLERGVPISVARDGGRRANGTVIRIEEHPAKGVYVAYRDGRTGAEKLTALENVRIERAAEKRRKAQSDPKVEKKTSGGRIAYREYTYESDGLHGYRVFGPDGVLAGGTDDPLTFIDRAIAAKGRK